MKLAALVQSYGNTEFLSACLKNLSWLPVLVVNSKFRYCKPVVDKTKEICAGLSGVIVMSPQCEKPEDSYNWGLNFLQSYDRVLICDSDEFILPSQREKFLELAKIHDSLCARINDYANRECSSVFEERTHKPVVCVNPNTVRFVNCRNVGCGAFGTNEVTVHHFGYALKDMAWKTEWAREIDKDGFDRCVCRKMIANVATDELLEIVK